MSATLSIKSLSEYFGDCVPCLQIMGRQFPVEQFFLEDIIEKISYTLTSEYERKYENIDDISASNLSFPSDTNLSASLNVMNRMDLTKINYDLISELVKFIIETNPANTSAIEEGSCLIFLPGLKSLNQCYEKLAEDFTIRNESKLHLLLLHSKLDKMTQSLIFNSSPKGKFKVVISTNIAETGITIPDVTYVIDSCRAKEVRFDLKKNLSLLVDVTISKSNLKQRQGRAGRIRSGQSFHLLPRYQIEKMAITQKPEISRLSLEEICIKFASLNSNDILGTFNELIEPPSSIKVINAIEVLQSASILGPDEKLTYLGNFIKKFPLDFRLGKMLAYGIVFGSLNQVITICSILSTEKSLFSKFNSIFNSGFHIFN